ncbi:uridine phosphorylase [Clostridia bacterium]|nr:uridine phosphorylase [Clostridia bacterium]
MSNSKTTPVMFEVNGESVLTSLKKGEKLPRYAILTVRDPLGFAGDAADGIAAHMEDVEDVTRNPMYTILSGKYKGTDMTICSSGSAGPEREIALLDLVMYAGVDTFLHLGTSGVHREEIEVGDMIISSGAVRDEGLTGEYVKKTYPAIANYELLLSLIEAAQTLNGRYHVGITRSNDSVYVGQGRPVLGYIQHPEDGVVDYWKQAGILNAERETAATLVLSSLFNCRGGSINSACNNTTSQEVKPGQGIDVMIETALTGLWLLSQKDTDKERANTPYWTPALRAQSEL